MTTPPTAPRGLALEGLGREAFLELFGPIFEHSPWVAARSFERGPFDTPGAIFEAMSEVIDEATEAERLALLRAHPELAGKVARAREMAEHSIWEQSTAGLDRLSDAEYARFERLNAAYRDRFDFPFIIAVRHHDKASILDHFERRLENSRTRELATALDEVRKIARLRFDDIVAGAGDSAVHAS